MGAMRHPVAAPLTLARLTLVAAATLAAAPAAAWGERAYALGDRRLSWKYIFHHWGAVERRIAQAGVRLAGILDRALGPPISEIFKDRKWSLTY